MEEIRDFSNPQIVLRVCPDSLYCFARPRRQLQTLALGSVGLLLSLTPLIGAERMLRHIVAHRFGSGDLLGITVLLTPFIAGVLVFIQFMRTLRRPRGIELREGIVTLHTPDSPVSRHQFERVNLDGAKLVRNPTGDTDLKILRRRSSAVIVLRNYSAFALGPAVDAINSLVVDDRHTAFEVILRNGPISPANGE